MAHEHLIHLARAAADADSLAEEIGVPGALARVGLNVDDVSEVAQQRALRVVMVESGRTAELKAAHARGSQRPQSFRLSAEEKQREAFYTTLYMDAITIGWWAYKLAHGEE